MHNPERFRYGHIIVLLALGFNPDKFMNILPAICIIHNCICQRQEIDWRMNAMLPYIFAGKNSAKKIEELLQRSVMAPQICLIMPGGYIVEMIHGMDGIIEFIMQSNDFLAKHFIGKIYLVGQKPIG